MSKVRILLADDHRLVAEGLRALLEPEFELVGIVEDGRELLDKAQQVNPDVIIVDITMPLLNGIDAVKRMKESGSPAKIIIVTMHHDALYARRAFEAGASGFLLKQSAADELLAAIREVLKDRTYITPIIAEELMQTYMNGGHKKSDPIRKLTSRQREVLQLLAEGKSAKEIAKSLHISSRTVETHKYQIMKELDLSTSADLVHFGIKHGIISI